MLTAKEDVQDRVQGLDAGRYLFQPLHRYLPETDSFETLVLSPIWEG